MTDFDEARKIIGCDTGLNPTYFLMSIEAAREYLGLSEDAPFPDLEHEDYIITVDRESQTVCFEWRTEE
jgi:hypothetical protein